MTHTHTHTSSFCVFELGSVGDRVAGVCEMFANELIKIIAKMKNESSVPQWIHAGRTTETGRRMIYEFKVLYKSKSREHSIQRTQNISIVGITPLSKVTNRTRIVVLHTK